MSVLRTGWKERHVEVKSSFWSSNVEFSIDACESHGRYAIRIIPEISWSLGTCS